MGKGFGSEVAAVITVVVHHPTGLPDISIGSIRQFVVRQISSAVVTQHEDVLAGRTCLSCPVDEVRKRIGAGDVGIVGTDKCTHVRLRRSVSVLVARDEGFLPVNHEACRLSGKRIINLEQVKLLQPLLIVGRAWLEVLAQQSNVLFVKRLHTL